MLTVKEFIVEEKKLVNEYRLAVKAKVKFDSGVRATKKAVADFRAKKNIGGS